MSFGERGNEGNRNPDTYPLDAVHVRFADSYLGTSLAAPQCRSAVCKKYDECCKLI